MRKIISHLKENWIRYGFETFVIMLSILGAFTLNNWNESRKEIREDIDFIMNLRIELNIDIKAYTERITDYEDINLSIKSALELIKVGSPLSAEESEIISKALVTFPRLTPVQKNFTRNDLIIAQGKLEVIDRDLNRRFISYLEETQSLNAIVTKFGESLQWMELNLVQPKVDYNFVYDGSINFDFNEILDDRGFNNALQRSHYWRKVYVDFLKNKVKEAERLKVIIDELIESSK